MKKIGLYSTAISLFLFIIIFHACKKNNDKKETCRISALGVRTSTSVNTFSYDASGRIIRLAAGGNITAYSYSANTTTVTMLDSGKFVSKTTVITNEAGLAVNVKTETNEAGTEWDNSFYEYTGDELMRSTNTSSNGGAPYVTTYTWKDHNMVSTKADTTTTNFGYYTDKPRQTGDYFLLVQTIQGYEIIRCKNLLKTVGSSTLAYEFGDGGKITSLSATTGASTSFLDFEYQCN